MVEAAGVELKLAGFANVLFTVHQKLHTEAVDALVANGQKIITSVTKVFSKSRDLYVFLQSYERDIVPMRPLVAFVTLYHGQTKALETTPLAVTGGMDEKTKAVPIRFTVPLAQVVPGEYTCQVTILDPNGQRAAFWQAPIVIVP